MRLIIPALILIIGCTTVKTKENHCGTIKLLQDDGSTQEVNLECQDKILVKEGEL